MNDTSNRRRWVCTNETENEATPCSTLVSKTGDIVWLMGPFAAGDWNDVTIFRFALKDLLDDNERVEADDGYVGECPRKVKTRTGLYADPDRSRMTGMVSSLTVF